MLSNQRFNIKPTHLTDYLEHNAMEYGHKPAIIFEGDSITWKELWQIIQPVSAGLSLQLSSDKQQVVGILLPNSIDFIVAYCSIVYSGHIAMPFDPAYKSLELDNIIEQLPPKLIITNQEYRDKLSRDHQTNAVLISEINSSDDNSQALRLPADQQIASLTFTSGTTGTPKTVPYTHSNHIWNIDVCSSAWDWTPDDSLLVNVPLSHFNGVVMALSGAIYHGNTIYLHRWFDGQATLEALASGKVSMFNHAASAYVKLVSLPKAKFDLSKVRLCTSGAAPLPPAVWQEFKDRFGIEIIETYGSSETGRIAGNRLNERRLGSPGKPFDGVKLRLSKEGEVEVKSPGVFPGYYNNLPATRASRTKDGYWRTGDIAQIKNGYIYLKGRVQERIRRFGYTISPRDVEWAMHQHAAVKDIYVMGRQVQGDPNDELIYFIVTELTDEQIMDYCRANLIFAWRPDKIIRLKELPKTRSGKAKIGELRQMAAN